MTTQHPGPATRHGLIAIPKTHEELAATVRDLHTLGLPDRSISVVGRQELTPCARSEAAMALAARVIEPGCAHELLGGTLGAALGLLGSLAVLTLPGIGPLVVGGGAAAVVLEGALGLAFGAGLGTTVAAFVDLATAARHDELFQRELDAGRWILVVGGTEEQLRRAEIVVSTHDVLHVDRV